MIRVNLIPRQRRQRQQARRRRAQWIRFLRAYSVVLAVGCALAMLPAHAAPPALDSSIARLNRRIQASTESLDATRKQLIALNKRLDLSRAVGDHPDWSALLGAVASARAGEAVLDSLDLALAHAEAKDPKPAAGAPPAKPDAKPAQRDIVALKLSGFCASPAGCFQFARRLEELGLFERVVVKDTRALPISIGAGSLPATRFEIEAVIPASPINISTPASPAPVKPSSPGGAK